MKEAINKFYINNSEIKSMKDWTDYLNGSVIYEVIKIIKGKPLFYEEHYNRMKKSFELKNLKMKISESEIHNMIKILVDINEISYGNIKIIYNIENKNLRIFFIKHFYPTPEMYKDGVNAITYFAERNNPNIKAMDIELRNNINKELKKRNAYEAVLIDNNGMVREGSRSNIFFVKENSIYTPKVEKVLPGVTRSEILKTAKETGNFIKESDIKISDMCEYDAVFISGTSPDILPINKIDENEFDVKNKIMRNLISDFNIKIDKYCC